MEVQLGTRIWRPVERREQNRDWLWLDGNYAVSNTCRIRDVFVFHIVLYGITLSHVTQYRPLYTHTC